MKVKSIYIIEDDLFFTESFKKRLEKIGDYEIQQFTSAEEALIHVEVDQPDIIFLDNNLPNMSGIDAIPLFKNSSPESEIAIVTMNKDVKVLGKAIEAGVSEFMLKDTFLNENATVFIRELEDKPSSIKSFWSKFFSS